MKQQFYSNRKFTCFIESIDEDGIYHLVDIDGLRYELTEDRFKNYYVPVERVKEKPKINKAEMAKYYSQYWVNNEDEKYIKGTLELASDKPC